MLDELYSLERNRTSMWDAVYRNELTLAIQKYENLQREWGKTTLVPAESSLSNWTAADCVKWLDSTQALPEYLTADLKERYSIIRSSIEDRLKTCRIDGVVTMFNNLSAPEKKQCLDILLQKMKYVFKSVELYGFKLQLLQSIELQKERAQHRFFPLLCSLFFVFLLLALWGTDIL